MISKNIPHKYKIFRNKKCGSRETVCNKCGNFLFNFQWAVDSLSITSKLWLMISHLTKGFCTKHISRWKTVCPFLLCLTPLKWQPVPEHRWLPETSYCLVHAAGVAALECAGTFNREAFILYSKLKLITVCN
jgi:hypothetical protein